MYNPSRLEARQFLVTVWQKHQKGQPLTDMERMCLAILLQHPEYVPIWTNPDKYLDADYLPEFGETNPFLHISMHLSIDEQLSIGQPFGLVPLYQRLCIQCGDEHAAQHEVMDGLAEMIWQAQKYQTAPDPRVYLDCLTRKLGESAV